MYNEKVMEAFKNPQNVGEIEDYSGLGKVGNAACGDIMQITLKIENDVIVESSKRSAAPRLSPRVPPPRRWLSE